MTQAHTMARCKNFDRAKTTEREKKIWIHLREIKIYFAEETAMIKELR